MTTIPHEPTLLSRKEMIFSAREMWASLAISTMWLVVLLDSLFGPDIVTKDAGGNYTTIPSAIFVALFALFGTIAVARYGLETRTKKS